LHARGSRPGHGAAPSSSRLRLHQTVRVQPVSPVTRLLSLPPCQVNYNRASATIHMADHKPVTLADLDARLREVEALQEVILRILSTTKPLTNVLDQYGATETQARACHALLD